MAVFNMKEYLASKKLTPAVTVGQSNSGQTSGQKKTSGTGAAASVNLTKLSSLPQGYVPSIDTVNLFNGKAFAQNALTNELNKQHAANGFGLIVSPSKNNVVSAFDPLETPNATVVQKVQEAKNNTGSGGTSAINTDYQSQLNDLYNKVMGYEGYTPSTYTPGSYTPSVYQRTVDTSGTEAMLEAALADIRGYGDFQYDLNADMLYKQAVDNYTMLGQQAMQDAMGQAAALTGGYGNSYAAAVGNQAYQQYLTQANNMIPEFQQMALNTWQSGYDRLLNDYNAVSQQLANLLNIEGMNFDIWNANESNAFNAFNANEQLAYNSWLANEQNNYNAWESGYNQLMDQYNLAKDYYATLEALNQGSGSGGSGTSTTRGNNTGFWSKAPAVTNAAASAAVTNPYTNAQLYEYLKNQKK